MRSLSILLWKEWRDARRLIAGACFATAVISALVRWIAPETTGAANTAEWIVPAFVAIFAAALASELVAGDVSGGRMTTLVLLPVPVRTVWRAKLAFLVTACAAFTVFVIIEEAAQLAVSGTRGAVSWYVNALPDALLGLAAAAAIGAGTLFFSTIVERGVAAVLAALAVLSAGGALVVSLNPAYYGVPFDDRHIVAIGVVTALTFVVAARLAFVRAPIHSSSKSRLAALGMFALTALIAPIGAGAAYAVSARQRVSPGGDFQWVQRIAVSPDGHHVAVQVTTLRAARYGRPHNHEDYAVRVWILRTDGGALVEVPERATSLVPDAEPWSGGRLRVRTRRSTAVERDGSVTPNAPVALRDIDPDTGETTHEERGFGVASAHRPGGERFKVTSAVGNDGYRTTTLIDGDTGDEIPLGRASPVDGLDVVDAIGVEGFVTAVPAAGRIVLRDRTGRIVRTLYPQEAQ